jgi:hypothetical protein
MKHIHLRNHTIFILGIKTGLRMSDLLRLTWKNLLSKDMFTITEHKTKKLRDIYITKILKDAIEEYKLFLEKNNIKFELDESVFLGKMRVEILDKDDPDIQRAEKSYNKVLKEAAIKIGITDNIGTHSMRKTYSYWFLLNNKNDPYAVLRLQEELNHDSLKSTFKYSGFSRDIRKKDSEEMDSLYENIINGTVRTYDDKITVSKGQVEDLLRYAYSLGKEPVTDFNADVDNLAALKDMLADLEL